MADETLPYAKSGGRLGGTGNLFGEERLPLHLAGATVANFRLTLKGELADGLRVQLYPNLAASPTYTTPLIFGGETFWWTTDLAAGLNQIQLVAEPANGKPLEYELAVEPLPSVLNTAPQTWSGVSSGTGGNSRIQIRLPVTGTYHVVADYPIGYANIFIVGPSLLNALAMATPTGSRQEFDVPLSEGTAAFEVRQSSPLPTTSWAVTVSLRGALAPVVTSLSPALISNASPRLLTIHGSNFQPGATVDLEAIDAWRRHLRQLQHPDSARRRRRPGGDIHPHGDQSGWPVRLPAGGTGSGFWAGHGTLGLHTGRPALGPFYHGLGCQGRQPGTMGYGRSNNQAPVKKSRGGAV